MRASIEEHSCCANAIWFFVLDPMQAFISATFFHGVRYLVIAIINLHHFIVDAFIWRLGAGREGDS